MVFNKRMVCVKCARFCRHLLCLFGPICGGELVKSCVNYIPLYSRMLIVVTMIMNYDLTFPVYVTFNG